jgi:hypothetical protein
MSRLIVILWDAFVRDEVCPSKWTGQAGPDGDAANPVRAREKDYAEKTLR